MKKDMGGAAAALALARMIMETGLDVRLRTLIPIVENAISGDAVPAGRRAQSRKGLTVEIGNTDAEGRLILADALALADEEAPDLMFDFATLTGAARVALGPDLPPFYTDDEALAGEIARQRRARRRSALAHAAVAPLRGDDRRATSPISTTRRAGRFAGSITAALFLARFVGPGRGLGAFRHLRLEPQPRAHGPRAARCRRRGRSSRCSKRATGAEARFSARRRRLRSRRRRRRVQPRRRRSHSPPRSRRRR